MGRDRSTRQGHIPDHNVEAVQPAFEAPNVSHGQFALGVPFSILSRPWRCWQQCARVLQLSLGCEVNNTDDDDCTKGRPLGCGKGHYSRDSSGPTACVYMIPTGLLPSHSPSLSLSLSVTLLLAFSLTCACICVCHRLTDISADHWLVLLPVQAWARCCASKPTMPISVPVNHWRHRQRCRSHGCN